MKNKYSDVRKRLSPLYMQIKEDILSRIESHEWEAGAKIPIEKELCSRYHVSVVTIREALKQLSNEGKVRRIPGKGTFITKPKMVARVDSLMSISRWAQTDSVKVATRVIKIETQKCNQYVLSHLTLKEGEDVTRVERLRIGNMEPLMFEILWVPTSLCPGLHLQDMTNIPLHDILRDAYGIVLTKAEESIEPVVADDYIQRLMGISEKTLLLKIEHSTFSEGDRVILFANSYYRGDRYSFQVKIDNNSAS
jgi:GntR family transcriptional regulator